MNWFHRLKRYLFSKEKHQKREGEKRLNELGGLFQHLADEMKIPGMAVSIRKKGQTFHEKGYGFEDLETQKLVDPKSTVFRIASISKCITGLALGKAVEEGLLDWDTSFYEYVSEYPKKSHDFTIRQLASHTAGIRGYRGKEFALNKPLSIQDSIEVFKSEPLVFEPGKGYLYNSFDFVLLSLAIQKASHMNFADYVKLKILEPLEMHSTFTPEEVELSSFDSTKVSISSFYTRRARGFKTAVEVNNQYKLGGGGYLSTCTDIAKMGQAILDRRLLHPSTYEELLKAQHVKGKSAYYGLGFQVSQDLNGRHYVGHVGNSVGAYSNFFVYPKEEVVISVLINCTDPRIQDELDKANLNIFA